MNKEITKKMIEAHDNYIVFARVDKYISVFGRKYKIGSHFLVNGEKVEIECEEAFKNILRVGRYDGLSNYYRQGLIFEKNKFVSYFSLPDEIYDTVMSLIDDGVVGDEVMLHQNFLDDFGDPSTLSL